MLFDKETLKSIKIISIGVLTCSALSLLIVAALKMFSLRVLLFCLLGDLVALLDFLWICISIKKAVSMGDKAKGHMLKSYMGRLVLCAGWVALEAYLGINMFNKDYAMVIVAALPVLYPSVTIKILNLFKSLRKEEEEKQ